MCEIIEKYKAEGMAQGMAMGRAEGRIEGRAEGRIEGRAEGRIEGLLKMAVSLWKKGRLTEQEAADEAGISLEDFKKAAAGATI